MTRRALALLLLAALPALGRPLFFEENRGQAGAGVKFLARGPGYGLFLGGRQAVFRLGGKDVRMNWLGGSQQVTVVGEQPLAGRTNYLTGRDPARWQTGVLNYQRVRYREVYRGIDLVFYSSREHELEYDLVVAPGADPSRIQLRFEGVPRAEYAAGGELQVGPLRLRKPHAYQAGSSGQEEVPSRYVMKRDGRIGLALGAYDRFRPLVIDPVLSYSSYLGGTGGGTGESIAVDAEGNIYLTGTTSSNHFPLSEPLQEFFFGSNEVYVAKVAPDGQSLIYSTYLGSWGDDRALDIAVDAAGNAYVTGHTTSPEFPITKGAAQAQYAGGSLVNGGDAFVLKLNPAGNKIVYSTYLGGVGNEYARSIVVDEEGNAYVTGATTSPDFPLVRPIQDFLKGTRDGFVVKLNPEGTALLYSTYYGGNGVEEPYGIAVGPEGSAYIAGSTTSVDDFPLVEPIQSTYGGGARDFMIARFSPGGTELVYSTIRGGTGDDTARGIAVDAGGSAYVAGYSTNSNFPLKNQIQRSGGGRDAVVVKLTPDGKDVEFATYYGGASLEDAFALALDADRNIYITGHTQSLNLPLVEPVQQAVGGVCLRIPCTSDIFIARISAKGDELEFSTYLGGRGGDQSRGIAVDGKGGAWVVGNTPSNDFPVVSAYQETYTGGGPSITFFLRVDRPREE